MGQIVQGKFIQRDLLHMEGLLNIKGGTECITTAWIFSLQCLLKTSLDALCQVGCFVSITIFFTVYLFGYFAWVHDHKKVLTKVLTLA